MGDLEAGQHKPKAETEGKDRKVKNRRSSKPRYVGLRRAIFTTLMGLGLAVFAWVRTRHLGPALWVLYGVTVVALLNIATFIPKSSWNRKSDRRLWMALFIVVVIVGFVFTYLGQPVTTSLETAQPFRGRVLSVNTFDDSVSTLVYAWNEGGHFQSRQISRLILLEIVNLQPTPTKIVAYTLDKLSANQEWERLDSVNVADPTALYNLTHNDATKAKQLDFSRCCFNTLADVLLRQGESIKGFVFLDDPQPNYKIERFRLTLENVQGQKQTLLLDYNLNVEKGLNVLGLCEIKVLPKLADISRYPPGR